MLLVLMLVSVGLVAVPSREVTVPEDERRAEDAWLRSFGLVVPSSGLVLERPFAAPLSSRSYVVPASWGRQLPTAVAPGDLLADLDVLKTAMEKAYSGWDVAARRGWNWDRWFRDWKAELRTQKAALIPLGSAFRPLKDLFDFQLDAHLGIGALGRPPFSRTALFLDEPTGTCLSLRFDTGDAVRLDPRDPAQRWRPTAIFEPGESEIRAGHSITYRASRGDAEAALCNGRWLRVRPVVDQPNEARVRAITEVANANATEPTLRRLTADIAYLRLPTFLPRIEEPLRTLANDADAGQRQEKVLIVDVRGNYGGGGEPVLRLLERWMDRDNAALFGATLGGFARTTKVSCLTKALRYGMTQTWIQGLSLPISAAERSGLQDALDAVTKPVPAGCPVTVETQPARWGYREHSFRADPREGAPVLMVLVDNQCASNCEGLVWSLGRLPQTVVVGVNTAGVGQFTRPGRLVLPHSRVPFQIPDGTSDLYGDGRSFEGYGLDVDVVLAANEAWRSESIVGLARRLLSGPKAFRQVSGGMSTSPPP